jgi:tRNA1(Val) A37 N6-methylase TrmN6
MAEPRAEPAHEISTDSFLDGRLRLRQSARDHRAGTDAVLLAAAAPADFAGSALDVGSGVGAAGLALATARPRAQIGLVEIDPFTAGLARENLALNGMADRGKVFETDIFSPASRRSACLFPEGAGLVITNPPFLDPGRARLSPHPGRCRAHAMPAEGPTSLAAWIAACLTLVEPGGLFILIHRPEALPAILDGLAKRVGGVAILPVYPRRNAPAVRILVRGKKGSRAPASIAPPLILHDGDRFTEAAEAIHRGVSPIDW